jgi:small subunit ribosomal protein S1
MTEELVTAVAVADLTAGTPVKGTVTYLAPYGAMVNIGAEREALLHISQLGHSNFRNIEDVLKIGDEIEAFVLKVDKDNRIALTNERPPERSWNDIRKGETYPGIVVRIESYGAFVDIGAERPGMVHVSELTDGYVQSPNDVVTVGQAVEVRVIKLNKRNRQIDLSMKSPVEEIAEVTFEPAEIIPNAMELAFRKAEDDNQRRKKGGPKKDKRRWDDDQDDIMERTLRNNRR